MFNKSSSNEGMRVFVEKVCSALNVVVAVPVPTGAVSITPLPNISEVMYNELFFPLKLKKKLQRWGTLLLATRVILPI